MSVLRSALFVGALCTIPPTTAVGQQRTPQAGRLAELKRQAVAEVEGRREFTAQMVDQIFSYGELGFQEFETSRYLVDVLRKHGFTVQENVAGIPTAWVATWGSGKPFISLGSDIDGIPQASQVPGVACHRPQIPGAPGHGEGHNSGQAVNITAALAVKAIMERGRLPGTLQIWPGVAEELVGTKAYFVREGMFRNADIVIFSHVANNLGTGWGDTPGNGLVSVIYSFEGRSAHSAGSPWRGRSALDAVSLMEVGWQFRREHLRLQHRSHSVVVDGGDQPNVVPPTASIWWYFREQNYPEIKELWAVGDSIAQGAALMTGTKLAGTRVVGSAWPAHFNQTMAEVMYQNIKQVGLPQWSDADQTLARAVQKELGVPQTGLATTLDTLSPALRPEERRAGFSDDIGDVSWNVPTATLSFPSNIPNLPGHNWSNAIAMATPLAHKGATAGAKAMAMTMLDFLTRPELIQQAWDYFRNVQTKDRKYQPLIRPQDRPAIELNTDILAKYRPEMRKYYYDPTRYKSYLEQLGVSYPTVRAADGSCGGGMVP